MTIHIHLGPPKSGTSTIQRFLFRNAALLEELGFTTPKTFGSLNHLKLAEYAFDPALKKDFRRAHRWKSLERFHDFQNSFADTFLQEATTWPLSTSVVITSEHLAKIHGPVEFARLKALLDQTGHDIRVVAYLRPQEEIFASSFSERTKGGRVLDLTRQKDLTGPAYADFRAMLQPWADTFGAQALRIGVFERAQMTNGDLLSDFCRLVDLPEDPRLVRPEQVNPALDGQTMAFLRHFAPYFPLGGSKRIRIRRKAIVSALEGMSTGPKVRLSQADGMDIRARFAEGNEYVARTYLGRADGRLFLADPKPGDAVLPAVTADQALDLGARLVANGLEQDAPTRTG